MPGVPEKRQALPTKSEEPVFFRATDIVPFSACAPGTATPPGLPEVDAARISGGGTVLPTGEGQCGAMSPPETID